MKYTKEDFKPTMTPAEIREYTKYTFWEAFGEGLITYGSWVMVGSLIGLTAYSLLTNQL